MKKTTHGIGLLLLALLPSAGAAQESRVDSLEARVRRLEALVDSLAGELRRVAERPVGAAGVPVAERPAGEEAPGERPAAEAQLEALRAAAAEAAAARSAERAEQGAPTQESRTRNLQALNPEISLTGDIVGAFAAPDRGDAEATAIPREFEFSFQAALDPYTHTKVFVTREEEFPVAGLEELLESSTPGNGEDPGATAEPETGAFEIEEGYMYWVGLPGGLGAKVGKFRQEIGLYNRWHDHALFEVDRPLPTVAFLGDEGLIQTGASLQLPSFRAGPATGSVWFEATRASNQTLFSEGGDASFLGRIQSFFDLGPRSFLQAGATGVVGQNDGADLTSRLLGLDLYYRWTPKANYRDLSLKGEWYVAERDFGSEPDATGRGGYFQANYRWSRRWIGGIRTDYLDGFGDGPTAWQWVPSLTWWQSEWVRLRIQANLLKREGHGLDGTILLQNVWAVGPHKHESY